MVIITGLPGTGKSTLARELAAVLDARHLNTDIVRGELGMRGQYNAKAKETVYEELLKRAGELLQQNQCVIIDGTFYKQSLRNRFLRLARRLDRDIRWIELRASEEVIRQRVEKTRPDSEADFEVYKKIKAIYEPLERGHLVLWSDELTVEEMTKRAKDFLMLPA
jgi:predicted kinase